MKKIVFIIAIVAMIVFLAVGGIFIIRRKGEEEPTPPQVEQEKSPTGFSLEERPYVTLTPRSDGKEFTLEISRVTNAETIEYELVYLSKGLSRGVVGSIEMEEKTSVTRKLLLGSCSRNVCKYDEGVEEGTLTIRFRGSDGARKIVSDFHLQQGDDILTSIDGSLKLEGNLPANIYYLTMSTIGLPGEKPTSEWQVLSGPYGIFSSGTQTIKNGKLTLLLSEALPSPILFFWQGSSWGSETSEIKAEGKTLAVPINQLGTFVAAVGLSHSNQ